MARFKIGLLIIVCLCISGFCLVCQNGGTPISTTMCSCSNKWTGLRCQIPNCQNGNLLRDWRKKMSSFCSCQHRWTGDLCQYPICLHGKSDPIDPTRCICDRQFVGSPTCSIAFDCTPHGKPIPNTDKCECDFGWEGQVCDTWACYHGNLTGQRKCKCNQFGEGLHCTKKTRKYFVWLYLTIVLITLVVALVLTFITVFAIIIMRKGKATVQTRTPEQKAFDRELRRMSRHENQDIIIASPRPLRVVRKTSTVRRPP